MFQVRANGTNPPFLFQHKMSPKFLQRTICFPCTIVHHVEPFTMRVSTKDVCTYVQLLQRTILLLTMYSLQLVESYHCIEPMMKNATKTE